MLDIYLPIAQTSINLLVLVFIGLASGLLSGLYGIGGGIIAVPIMILSGIPTPIAIATSLLQILAISSVNVIRNISSGNVKFNIGLKLGVFSIFGSLLGTKIFIILSKTEYFYTIIYFLYTLFIGYIAFITIKDAVKSIKKYGLYKSEKVAKKAEYKPDKAFELNALNFENFMSQFGVEPIVSKHHKKRKQEKFLNGIKIAIAGFSIGIVSGILGVGGGFITMPVIMYIFRQNIQVAAITSAFVAFITTMPACIKQFIATDYIDPVLAISVCIFAAIGVRFGNQLAKVLPLNILKILFGTLLVSIAIQFAVKILIIGNNQYIISIL